MKSKQSLSKPISYLILLLILLLVSYIWGSAVLRPADFQLSVYQFTTLAFLETTNTYYYLHLITLIPILLLSFDSRVRFYRSWRYLIPAIAVVGLLFLLWDVWFTHLHVWGFNPTYFSGATFLDLPIEEWLFFLSVPFACVFIYECLNYYIEADYLKPYDRIISPILILLLLVVGILNWSRLYTSTTFLLTGGFLLFHWVSFSNTYRSRFYLAYLVSLVPFLLINGVLTGGFTEQPVVLYNSIDNLGIRIGSVPLEDTIYSLLLFMGIVTLFEHFRAEKKP